MTSSNFVAVGSLDAPGQTDTASVPETGVSSGVLVSLAEFAGQEGQELGVFEPGSLRVLGIFTCAIHVLIQVCLIERACIRRRRQ